AHRPRRECAGSDRDSRAERTARLTEWQRFRRISAHMDARTAGRIESVVDAAAASLLAGAVGYAVYKLAIAQAAVAGAGVAFGLSFDGLRPAQPNTDTAHIHSPGA